MLLPAARRFNYAVARRFVRLLARPTVNAATLPGHNGEEIVYALANRSLADIVLLDLVASDHGLPSPLSSIDAFDEARRFFFLNRPAGWTRRHTMRTTSPRMRRLEAKLRDREHSTLALVPVSIFWGRAANKDKSWVRSLFSEGWAMSSRLRRFLILIFNRGDILVQFGQPMGWREIVRASGTENLATRRTARLLRVKFRNQKVAALGPDLSHRRTLVGQILASAQVSSAIGEMVAAGASQARVERAARQAAYGIASDMSYPAIRFLDKLLTWLWHRIYEGVRVAGIEKFERLAATHTLIYTPCHRSHLDYLLLSYVLFHRGLMLPHIAAGDNLDLPVVGRILRGGGAFFMRRQFGTDALYVAVFSEYLYQMFRRGHAVEYFVEGGRSRTGRLLPAHTGMLRMTIDAYRRGLPRPLAFVPVYFGYEKVIEANAYLDELRGAAKRRETVGGIFRSLRLIRESFGTVQVRFGEPIDLADSLGDPGNDRLVRALGRRILGGINDSAYVNAVSLVALATLSMPRQFIDETTLKTQIELYRNLVEQHDNHAYAVTGASVGEVIRHVEDLGLLTRENVAGKVGDILGHDPVTAVLMTWYRNNVLHTIAAPSLIACLVANRRGIRRVILRRLFEAIYPYIARELSSLGADGFGDWLERLHGVDVIEQRRGTVSAPADPGGRYRLRLLANTIMPVLERFYITLALLHRAGSGVLDQAALLLECRATAARFSKLYGLDSPEFADARLFSAFLAHLTENEVLIPDDAGRLEFDERVADILRAGRYVVAVELRQSLEQHGTAK
ncbi:MAG: glycerol-3-phosphate 1-O-acyltransferase PlsB [Gammaproteobacteria bacterium]|nr:glycerol-3-phosphate 1-O-acyltransferase PlsB [Gammaproteobacteria bacterium]